VVTANESTSATPEPARHALRALLASPVFGSVSPVLLSEVARHCSLHPFARGERVVSQGQTGTAVYVVARGRVEYVIESTGDRRWVRGVFGPGGTFGVSSALDGEPHACTARACCAAGVVEVPAIRVRDLLEADRGFALAVARSLAAELRRLVHYAESVTLRSVRERLALYLLQHDEPGSTSIDVSQSRIAAEIGTVREVVARALRALEDEGVVRRRGRTVEVLRRDALAACGSGA
jgi:CRP/FNR family transcriptional regulator